MNSFETAAPLETNPVEAFADETHPDAAQAAAAHWPSPAGADQEVPCAQHGGDIHIRALIAGLDLSEAEWLRVLNAHNGQPSERRQFFGETLTFQAKMLGVCVYDDAPCAESKAFERRLGDLPFGYQLAVLEVIERFWSRPEEAATFEEIMCEFGVCFCETAHQRIRAYQRRQEALSSELEVVRKAHQSLQDP